jgi:PHD/YefM family antitoxin component YafN of YafNO toxin-antitoxin module
MFPLKNIHPLSDFVRNAKARAGHMTASGEPEVLTVNGQAVLVVMSAAAYEKLIEELETERTLNVAGNSALELLRSGAISARDLSASLKPNPHVKSMPAAEAFAELEKQIQLRRKKKAS